MEYVSTRGRARPLPFDDVVLAGLAPDGGLYVPAAWPHFSPDEIAALAGLPYPALAARVMAPFLGDSCVRESFGDLVADAYTGFGHHSVAPLHQIGPGESILELFHGPTLAFKDIALQLLGRLFDRILAARDSRVTIVGATSGDTGSAAIEACRGRPNMDVFILHPQGRVSDVQRRQMTTLDADNVHNLAIEGTFDDCQALVKALFADAAFRQETCLSAVNSINWARVMAQTVYYFAAAAHLGAPGRTVSFSVPTGNFGDVYAGYVARRMGLPIGHLIVATNVNDILGRFLTSGEYRISEVRSTLSPSMDIQVASNFERYLFDLLDRDGRAVEARMAGLRDSGCFSVDGDRLARAAAEFVPHRVDEAGTLAAIARVYGESGILLDPHGAIGVAAGRACREFGEAVVALATAHPAKFPDAVARGCGVRPELPAFLADLFERPEHFHVMSNEIGAVRDFIRARRRA